jgi:WD40 repeat protein
MATLVRSAISRSLPYAGPRPYTRSDHEAGRDLFGRDAEVEALFNMLIAQRIVLMYSPSGAGKTSLIEARLVPRLEEEGFAVLPAARVGLSGVLSREYASGTNRYALSALSSMGAEIGDHAASLQTFLDARAASSESPQLVIFDQFEEVLVEDPTDIRAKEEFFKELGTILRARHRWALLAMREDYVAGLDPFLRYLPGRLSARFRLDLLAPRAARSAIVEPASSVHVDLSPVADQLVRELSMVRVQRPDGTVERLPGPYIEPVQLQVVCLRLWARLPAGATRVDESDVEAVGDVDDALAAYYADCVASTARDTGVHERRIREWFHEHLITPQGVRGQVLQGVDTSEGLANTAIWAMVDAHLLRAERRRGFTWFELSHDRLVEPVQKDNARWFQMYLSPIQYQAAEWDHQQRRSNLLLTGRALREADRWESAHRNELTTTEREFLEISRAAQTARERRLNSIIRVVTVIAALIAILCIGLSVVASRFAAIAQVRELAITAQQQADPELALLLAIEAANRQALPEVDSTLRQAFVDSHSRTTLRGHTAAVWNAIFSPDGASVITASIDHTARIWDAGSGTMLGELAGGPGDFCGLAISHDGRRLATTSERAPAHIWDTSTRTVIATLDIDTQQVCPVDFSPDGNWVITGGTAGAAHISDASTGHELLPAFQLKDARTTVWSAAFDPQGSKVVTALGDGTAIVWDIATRQPLVTLKGHSGNVWDAVFSPDGSKIATAGDDETARVWDANSGEQIAILTGHSDTLTSVAFSPDSRRVLTASHDTTARIWDAATGQPLMRLQGHIDGIRSAVFSPDGKRAITASDDGTARIWDVTNGETAALQLDSGEVWTAEFAPEATRRVVLGSEVGAADIWDPGTGALVPLRGHTGEVWRAAFSPDGLRVATVGGGDKTARIWDAATGRLIQTLSHPFGVRAVNFSPDGAQVATASDDGMLRVWNATNGQLVGAPVGDPGWSQRSVLFSQDGKRLLAAGTDKSASIWDLTTGQELLGLDHGVFVRDAVYTRDGARVLTASVDRDAQIWDVSTGARLLTLHGHSAPVWTAEFSPDGLKIVTASEDGTARVWDATTGRQMLILRGHSGPVRSAAFSPDGTEIVTAGSDGTVRIYGGCQLTCSLPDLLAQARKRVQRELTPQERSQYVPNLPFGPLSQLSVWFDR